MIVFFCGCQALKSSQRPPSNLVSQVDPDAPTRENLKLHPQDSEDEELLMRGVWTLLKAGRLSDAHQLCRDVGQAWRAASLGGTGDAGPVPSVEGFRVLAGTKRAREEQAAEIEAGGGRQRRLWKWTCFLASEKVGCPVVDCWLNEPLQGKTGQGPTLRTVKAPEVHSMCFDCLDIFGVMCCVTVRTLGATAFVHGQKSNCLATILAWLWREGFNVPTSASPNLPNPDSILLLSFSNQSGGRRGWRI